MFLLFLLLPLLAVAYVAWHVWMVLPLPTLWRMVIVLAGVAAFLTLLLDLGRKLDAYPLPLARTLYETGTSSLIVLLYLTLLFLVLDLGRLFRLVPRSLLSDSWPAALTIFGLIAVLLLYGNYRYRHKVRVELALTTSKPLPKAYIVVMASDLHLGYHNPRKELARWVDMINQEHPDLILIAGDIIDISVRPLVEEDMAQEFRRLHAPVYACLGNHEYYSGEPQAQQFYRDAGIRLLEDSACTVLDGAFLVIGRDDRTNQRRKPLNQLMADAKRAVGDSAAVPYTILLDHQPYHLEQSEQAGVDFQLSGHTHRGQVWPISWITDVIYECSWGAHRLGNTRYYISSGLGIWGGKYRIGTQSEYVVATISKE